ncbi:MAG TPA: hypothetical protein VGP33_07305, partial [Chloroflexota bacterium]|nr:hypothetical protein [Chloroflexota bacterium]
VGVSARAKSSLISWVRTARWKGNAKVCSGRAEGVATVHAFFPAEPLSDDVGQFSGVAAEEPGRIRRRNGEVFDQLDETIDRDPGMISAIK